MKAILAGIFTESTKGELLRLEREEADLSKKVRDAEHLLETQPTEDDIISYLELFRDGCTDPGLTRSAILDAFVTRVEVCTDTMNIYFQIKKEGQQKTVDLPSDLSECSYRVSASPHDGTIRTLKYFNNVFILQIPA